MRLALKLCIRQDESSKHEHLSGAELLFSELPELWCRDEMFHVFKLPKACCRTCMCSYHMKLPMPQRGWFLVVTLRSDCGGATTFCRYAAHDLHEICIKLTSLPRWQPTSICCLLIPQQLLHIPEHDQIASHLLLHFSSLPNKASE